MARPTDHNRAEDLISAYLDQQVTAEEKQFFELHIAACANCRAQLEATRSMVAALKAMPIVKASRSFVLPREMAKQPKRSIFAWYPTLRLATALAAIAFVVLFAGDMLISRSGRGGAALSIPMAAPAPQLEQGAAPPQAPAATVVALAAPTEAPAPEVSNTTAATAPGAAAPAGTAAKSVSTDTATLTDTAATMLAASTPTLEVTAVAAAPQPLLKATPEPAADAQAKRAATSAVEQPVAAPVAAAPAPTIDPLRVIELVLLGLVIVLGAAMLIVRRKQV